MTWIRILFYLSITMTKKSVSKVRVNKENLAEKTGLHDSIPLKSSKDSLDR